MNILTKRGSFESEHALMFPTMAEKRGHQKLSGTPISRKIRGEVRNLLWQAA